MLASARFYEADLVSATFHTPKNGKTLNHRGYFISGNGMVGPIMDDQKPTNDFIENTTSGEQKKTIEYAHPVLIKISAFKELGGYDERFKGSQYADMDFVYRAKKAGYRTYMQGSVFIYHHFKENGSTNAVKMKHRADNEKLFRQKHGFGRRAMRK